MEFDKKIHFRIKALIDNGWSAYARNFHCYAQNPSLKTKLTRYKSNQSTNVLLFLIFNASKLLTKITLLKSHENDDFIDFS